MRSLARLLLATALAALPVGLALASCGTDAVDVDACRQIETARCNAAPACVAGFDVDGCTRFYRDACLVGLGNADAGTVTALIQPCIAAIDGCAADPASAEAGCPGEALFPGAKCMNGLVEVRPTPCNIVMHCPEVLEACHFVATPPTVDAGDGGDGGDAEADGGDAEADGGDGGDGGADAGD